jgi:hypothetical protein
MSTQELPVYEEVELKPLDRGERIMRSEKARARRKGLKTVREQKVLNEWARARRAKKKRND